MLPFLEHWEPLWLLIILVWELYETKKANRILEEEYQYDKTYNERMEAREKRREARKKERMQPLEKDMD